MKLMRIEQAIVAAAKNIYNVFLDDIVTGDFDPPIAKWRMNTKFGIFQSRYEVHSQPTRIVMEVDLNLFCQASARNLLSRALVDNCVSGANFKSIVDELPVNIKACDVEPYLINNGSVKGDSRMRRIGF